MQVGSILIKLVLESLEITQPRTARRCRRSGRRRRSSPSRARSTKQFRVHKQGYLVADPEVIRQLEENKEVRVFR